KLAARTVRSSSTSQINRQRLRGCRSPFCTLCLVGIRVSPTLPSYAKMESACAGVGSGVSTDRDQKVHHAARLDRPGTAYGEAWGYPGKPRHNLRPARA